MIRKNNRRKHSRLKDINREEKKYLTPLIPFYLILVVHKAVKK